MQLLGASAGEAGAILDAAAAAARQGHAAVVWCDGSDAVAVIADEGDGPSDVRRIFLRAIFEAPDTP